MLKVLFLDRDGIINVEKNYLYKIEDFEFINDTLDLIKKAKELGYEIIVVSNQAGIAKGKYTLKDLEINDKWLKEQFLNMGTPLLDTFYCPNHKDGIIEEYAKDSYDRKPNPGMLLKAKEKYDIDMDNSIMIGDRFSDILAGYNAHVKRLILLEADYNYRDFKKEDFPFVKYEIVKSIKEIVI